MPQLPYGYPGAHEQRDEHNYHHINHGLWERCHSLGVQECQRITPEEEMEEDNEVPETIGGQRRMCVDISGASNMALMNGH